MTTTKWLSDFRTPTTLVRPELGLLVKESVINPSSSAGEDKLIVDCNFMALSTAFQSY